VVVEVEGKGQKHVRESNESGTESAVGTFGELRDSLAEADCDFCGFSYPQ
jgi:hypothetical protein